ncbi:hypothetical protein GOV09_06425, partial [Candidatus Woesearchaeota archaeon]|nr:hypothetical protein [Candidatus Woesearchaeota archaeon]
MGKAQVSLFIILGIVILGAVGMFFYFRGEVIKGDILPAVTDIVEELPSEFLPVQPFVERCLEDTATNGLHIMGQRGGYIYTEALHPGGVATEGDSVAFSRDSEMIIPYWHYLASENECTGECEFSSKMLELRGENSVEEQLERYVDEHLKECIAGFGGIEELGFIVDELKEPTSTVTIAERNVIIELDYPLEVSRGENRFDIERFFVTLDLDLRKVYEMATYLTELQQEFRFLERATTNLIVGFSGVDKEKLPPMSDTTFEFGSSVRWNKRSVKRSVQSVVMGYIPLLRVVDSLNWREIDTGRYFADKIFNRGMSMPNNISIHDVNVNFNYLDFWDMYFDLNCRGDICEPEAMFTDLLPIGLQRYNFVYDVSYPVMVELEDPAAFNDQGYTFNFMLEANVRNNEPMPALFTPIVLLDAVPESLLCDGNKRNSGEVIIETYDSLTDNALDDVQVYYTCIDSCYIGETEEGRLESSFPVCLGGSVLLKKEGYEDHFFTYDSSKERSDRFVVKMNPIKELTVEVKKKLVKKQGDEWVYDGQISDLAEDELAFVSLSKDNDFDLAEITFDKNEKITVAEGTYEISIDLIKEKGFVIPEHNENIAGESIKVDEFSTNSLPI